MIWFIGIPVCFFFTARAMFTGFMKPDDFIEFVLASFLTCAITGLCALPLAGGALANAKRPSTSEDIMYLLVQYAGIDAATVEALGGKDFPPLPMYPIT